jgi:hypothetical protein
MQLAENINGASEKAHLLTVVDKLKLHYADPNLSVKIKQELKGEYSPSDAFFIKAEIKRLANPCARLIDLRTISSGITFSTFEWEGMMHVMDKDSAQNFVKLIKQYDGEYTFGVYESVINTFKKNKEKAKKSQFSSDMSISAVSLSEVYSRNEERMNLGVKILAYPLPKSLLEKEDPDLSQSLKNLTNQASQTMGIEGNTVDISQNGLQVRLPQNLAHNSVIAIRFKGLEEDFVFKEKYVAYEVVKSVATNESDDYLISLRQLSASYHNEFQGFTQRLIYANKRRYKVNLDNTVKSVKSKLYEQFYLSRKRSLDLFVDRDGGIPYMLSSDPCLEIVESFSVSGKQYLTDLLIKDDVLSHFENAKDIYWLAIVKPSSKSELGVSFYSTVLSSPLSYKLAAYALRSKTGKLFKLSLSGLDEVNPFVTSSLPRAIHKQMGNNSIYRYSPRLKKVVGELTHLITLKEITNNAMDKFDTFDLDLSKEDSKACSSMQLSKSAGSVTEVLRLESNEFRKEDRFLISTPVSVTLNGRKVFGQFLDVSTRGMSLKLQEEVVAKAGTEVKVTLLDFASKELELNLNDIPYKVISCKANVIRLQAMTSKGFVGVQFWDNYISENIESLKIVGSQESHVGLRRALRNIAAQLHTSVPAFFTTKDSRPCVRSIALSPNHADAPLWSSIYGDFTIDTQLKSFLYNKSMFKRLVLDLPEIKRDTPFKNYFVLVKYQQSISGQIEIGSVTFLPEDDPVGALKKELNRYSYDYRIFHVSLTKKSRLFDRYFKDELAYLESYASHKSSKLMFEIKTLSGVLDFEDVTQLLLPYIEAREVREWKR